jgi:hypothetical protein
MAERTPGEWIADGEEIVAPGEIIVATCNTDVTVKRPQTIANAKYICKSVNSHQALCEALEFYSDTRNFHEFLRVLQNDHLLNPGGPPDAYGISDDVCLKARAALLAAGWKANGE